MKKLFTLAAAVLASFSLFAATETHPSEATKDADLAGTSYTIPGTYIAGLGGTKSGDMQSKGIKFRLSQKVDGDSKGFVFNVNEGYKITEIAFCGHVNDDTKTSTLAQVKVDGVSINYAPVQLAQKSSSTSFAIQGIAALHNVVLIFDGTGTQANLEYTVTYEEAVQKEVDHVVETLTGAAVNGVALKETEMSTLLNNGEFEDLAYYVEAPTVTFTVQTDTYYVGEETPSTKSEDIDVVAELAAGMWMAQYTIGEQTYTIRATKPETRTITFMDGETVLGTEVVAKGDPSTKHANFETKPLAKFEGWFRNPDFTSQIDIETYAINEDQTLYGKFVKAYAQSLNIEQLVLDNGKGAKIDSILTARGYEFANIDQLDSLNDGKGNARNEAYLGLKIKKQGGYIACNLQAGTTIRVKFGYVANDVLAIAGTDPLTLTPTNNALEVLEFTAEAETYVQIQTTTDKTVVIKQIAIDEAITDVMHQIVYAETENGTVSGWTVAFEGETVVLTVTPDAGYSIGSVILNDAEEMTPADGVYSFVMPAADVNVKATFMPVEDALENTNATKQAVKVVRNGQIMIIRGDNVFNILGTELK